MAQIDLKKVIEKKSKFLARFTFIINFLRRLIHEDGINQVLSENRELTGFAFVKGVLKSFRATIKTNFRYPIDENARYVFVANHPLGGLDGVAFIAAISEKFPEIRFPVNDFLLNIKNFDPIFLAINKHGKQDREAVRKINEAYASQNQQILMFPAGLVSRKINGKIVDLEWQKHFITKAIQNKRDIVPVYIDGKNTNRFYRIANWRKWLGIKFNIEMLLLPSEMFKQKNQTITIIVGGAISYQSFDNSMSHEEWAQYVKNRVYELS